MDYYYSLNNQPSGPVPLEQLHELHRTGVITLETLVVPVGGTEWKPYATLRAAPQDVAGSAVPGDVPPAVAAAPTASSSAPPPPPGTTPGVGSSPSAGTGSPATPRPAYGHLVLISWVLLGLTALISVIPVVGCITWVMLIPVFIATVIMGVLTIQRGGTTPGVIIIIASVVVLPLFTLLAPIVTTALFGAVTGAGNKPKVSPAPVVVDASPTPATPRATSTPAGPAAPARPGVAKTADAPDQLFARLDITEDGTLSGTEMKGYEGYDTNKDNRLSKEEFLAGSARDTRLKAIASAIDQFLIMLNNGRYDESFDAASESFRDGATTSAWANNMRKNREALGKAIDHQLTTIDTKTDLTSGKKSYVVPVASTFEKGKATETITLVQDADGQYRVADYSLTTEISAPQPTPAGVAGAATGTPNEEMAKQMVDATMTSFKNAVNSGSFDAFYRTELSNLWKKQIKPDTLRASFKPFIDRKVDLSPIFNSDPVLDEPPYVDGNGLLTLVGHYPVPQENVKVTFELSYSREATKWALSGIKVNIKSLEE